MSGSRASPRVRGGTAYGGPYAVLRALWRGRPAATAAAEAERALATLFLLLRAGVAVQVVLGSVSGVGVAVEPAAYAALAGIVVLHTVASAVITWRAQTVLPGAWGWLDLGVSLAAVVGCAVLLPDALVVGTWQSWGPGYAGVAVGAVGVWCRRAGLALALSAGVALVYAVAVSIWSTGDPTTITANTLRYLIFGASAIVFSRHWRRLAATTDAATRLAVQAAEQAQTDRYRLMVHDIASILRLLGDENTPAVRLPALRRQARDEAHRLRAYLTDTPSAVPGSTAGPGAAPTLGGVITDTVSGFTDLPLDLLIDLGARARLPAPVVPVLSAALSTLLHNVRVHASATEVVLHADAGEGTWEVVLADNGVGFDPATTPYGFGLREQVIRALAAHHVVTQVRSTPGRGCTVTLTGAAESAEAERKTR